MDVNESRPSICRHVGLDCASCVNASARKVAALCGHLDESRRKSVFVKLYPDAVCHQNLPRFHRAYERAVREIEAAEPEDVFALDFAVA